MEVNIQSWMFTHKPTRTRAQRWSGTSSSRGTPLVGGVPSQVSQLQRALPASLTHNLTKVQRLPLSSPECWELVTRCACGTSGIATTRWWLAVWNGKPASRDISGGVEVWHDRRRWINVSLLVFKMRTRFLPRPQQPPCRALLWAFNRDRCPRVTLRLPHRLYHCAPNFDPVKTSGGVKATS